MHCVIKDFSYTVDNVADEQYLDVENFQLVHKYEEWDDSSEVIVSINNDKSIKEINIIDNIKNPFVICDTHKGILKVLVSGDRTLETVIDSQEGIINYEKIWQLKDTLLVILTTQKHAA